MLTCASIRFTNQPWVHGSRGTWHASAKGHLVAVDEVVDAGVGLIVVENACNLLASKHASQQYVILKLAGLSLPGSIRQPRLQV